jgi:hypothetical protein
MVYGGAVMMSPAEIESILHRLGQEWPTECSLVDAVGQRLESESIEQRRRNGSPPFKWMLATAAAMLLVTGLWWIIHDERSLYAQAIDEIKAARTVCITATAASKAEGTTDVVRKAWYQRGVGFREEWGNQVRIGNNQQFWTYLKDSGMAIRSQSRGLDSIIDSMLNDTGLSQFKQSAKIERYSSADETIDGQPCRAYLETQVYPAGYPISPEEKKIQRRGIIFLDDKSRPIRFLSQLHSDDGWTTKLTTNLKYDVPIDPSLFTPVFGDNVKIVDADQAFDEFVNLKKSIYQEERHGLIFAIHRLERFQDGIYIVSSVRGTEDTLKKYPLKQRLTGPGLMFDEGPAANYEASPLGSGYFRIDLARADYHGINLCWWVLVPRGVPLSHFDVAPGLVKLPIGITPHGDFAKDNFAKNGVIQHLTWDLELSLPKPPVLLPTGMIAAQAYADQVALEAIPFRRLDMGSKNNFEQFSRPEDVSVPRFETAVIANIRSWRQMDVDFQLNGQFAAGGMGNDEAIGLSYEPTVDDATLAQVAKRDKLKRLYLDGTKITDVALRQLADLHELRELSLAHTAVTDAGLKEIEGLNSLRDLDVRDTKATHEGIARLKRALPDLKVDY